MLHSFMQGQLESWQARLTPIPTPRALQQVGEDVAVRWLEIVDSSVNWSKFIAYIESVRFRTYENDPVMMNVVIGAGQGVLPLSDRGIQKVVDPLSASQRVYFRVDRQLRFLDYQEILWKQIRESSEYKFIPGFLEPFGSILLEGEFSVHLTRHGDFFIMDSGGLLAANRKGRWLVYDAEPLKNAVRRIVGNVTVGNNLFELMFDISYRRHGALLVYDPDHKVLAQVVNPQSIIKGESASPDVARAMLTPAIQKIGLGGTDHPIRKKNLFLEIAGLDGAVIFDSDEILAIGAMVKQHPNLGDYLGDHLGARTIANLSAFRYGGIPIKVSADGEIQIPFESSDSAGRVSEAEMTFS